MKHFKTGETKPNGKPRIVGRNWPESHEIPDGWTEVSMAEVAELTGPTKAEQRDAERRRIQSLLDQIDIKRIRSVCAKESSLLTPQEKSVEQNYIDQYEAEARALRAQLPE